MKNNLHLLGIEVLPLVRRCQYGAANHDPLGLLEWKHGKERQEYARSCVDTAVAEQKRENKNQRWIVHGIFSDGTFELLSDMGYSQKGVSRRDFRILKVTRHA